MDAPIFFAPRSTGEGLQWVISSAELGFAPAAIWNPSPSSTHRTAPYPVPQALRIGIRINALTSAKFSPPPMVVVVEGEGVRCFIGIKADPGWHRWNEVDFSATEDGVSITIDLEGRTIPGEIIPHVSLAVIRFSPELEKMEILSRGLALQYPPTGKKAIPEWWLRPIYCGWGDQVAHAMVQEGIGKERRAMAYCIQGLYERWISSLERAGVPVGTIIIDGGWSLTGVWKPDPIRWPDLRKFIDRQHDAGRKVLLWLGTWLWDGLSEELSILGDGRQWTADPSNPRYLETISEWVTELLSPDGYNADGFKIDQLSYSPNVRQPRWCPRFGFAEEGRSAVRKVRQAGEEWGIELLYRYQKTIYDAAKAAKPDALITSSTVHPYFADSFDMVRLHDMGAVPNDLMEAMKARSRLAHAALPGFPIDADDWIHQNYEMWLDYTSNSHEIGVPCIFFTERFIAQWKEEPGTRPIPDLEKIAESWCRAGYEAPKARYGEVAGSEERGGYQSE